VKPSRWRGRAVFCVNAGASAGNYSAGIQTRASGRTEARVRALVVPSWLGFAFERSLDVGKKTPRKIMDGGWPFSSTAWPHRTLSFP
jgi:hypothetical protein